MNKTSLLIVAGLLVLLVARAYRQGGGALVTEGFGRGARLLYEVAPILALSLLVAGVAQVLVPRAFVESIVGARAGVGGIVAASAAGALMPGGPYIVLPIAAALAQRGAGVGALVAFVSGWALLGLHRLIAWEIPVLGARLALLRYAVCLILPAAAGLIARALARS